MTDIKRKKKSQRSSDAGCQDKVDENELNPSAKKKKFFSEKKADGVQNNKSDKNKERRHKKKDKRSLMIAAKANHIHETKGQGKAIRYLDAWQTHHDGKTNSWKFEKCRQIWLLSNAYDETKVPDAKFDSLLRYMASIRGQMRQITLETAKQKLKMAEEAQNSGILHVNQDAANESEESKTENTENENKHNAKTKKRKIKSSSEKNELPTEKVIQRAADIIEMLKD